MEKLKTSETRTKEVRRLADKLIALASQNTLAARRELHKFFAERCSQYFGGQNCFELCGKKSGFTALEKLAPRRGDNTVFSNYRC
jgi:large subunit ribosomal protein L17